MSSGVLYHALHASWAVKWVMVSLLGLSVASWAIIVERYRYLKQVEVALSSLKQQAATGTMLHQTLRVDAIPSIQVPLEAILKEGVLHYHRSHHLDRDQVIARCRMVMSTPLMQWEQALNHYLSWLASIASISPYIGLLGTVLGIMMAFAALSGAKSANMMVVAPGIAEALVTTALGLVVAIPASVAYNQLSGWCVRLTESMHALVDQLVLMIDDERSAEASDASY